MKKLNILVFGQSFLGKIGGVQQSYAWLYDYLCGKGHKITHITHLPIPDQGLHYPFPPAVEIRGLNLLFVGQGRKRIIDLAHEIDPDVILVVNSGIRAAIFCEALRDTPYPVVLSERGSPEYCITELWGSRRLHELAIGSVEFFHMLMPSYLQFLPEELRERARIISSLTLPSPTSAIPDKPDINGKYTIIYTGRFSEEKRLPLLIAAFGILADAHPDWKLKIVGSGEEETLINAAESAGVLSRLELPGYASDPEELARHYDSSHIYCLPSSFEGCPLALREAMAHALPVIGFMSCPGTNEIIRHEKNGLLASEDSAESLAACLERLINDAELRVVMGRQGKKDVNAYTPEITHSAWEALLVEAAAWKGKKRQLRLRRFMRSPLKTAWRMLQPLPEYGARRRDIFAPNPLSWFRQVGKHVLDFSLLNYFNVKNRRSSLTPNQIMEYKTSYAGCLEQMDAKKAETQIERNMRSLAIRHGINLANLYHNS